MGVNDTITSHALYDDKTLAELVGEAPPPPPAVAPVPAQESSSLFRRVVGDTAVTALKGAIGLPESIVGIADIPTGGRVGKGLEYVGFRPREAKQTLDELYSPEQKAAFANVQQAKGFLPTIQAIVDNPSVAGHTALESAPSLLGVAGVARGAIKVLPKLAPFVAGAIGEGAVTAGSTAEAIRAETPDHLLTPQQAGLAGLSGVVTAGIGAGSGKLADWAKIANIETMLAGGGDKAINKGLVRQLVDGAFTEGVLEELPQSMQEQALQNVALGKPWHEGVLESGAQGMITGGLMGAGGSGVNVASTARHSNAFIDDVALRVDAGEPVTGQEMQMVRDIAAGGLGNRAKGLAADMLGGIPTDINDHPIQSPDQYQAGMSEALNQPLGLEYKPVIEQGFDGLGNRQQYTGEGRQDGTEPFTPATEGEVIQPEVGAPSPKGLLPGVTIDGEVIQQRQIGYDGGDGFITSGSKGIVPGNMVHEELAAALNRPAEQTMAPADSQQSGVSAAPPILNTAPSASMYSMPDTQFGAAPTGIAPSADFQAQGEQLDRLDPQSLTAGGGEYSINRQPTGVPQAEAASAPSEAALPQTPLHPTDTNATPAQEPTEWQTTYESILQEANKTVLRGKGNKGNWSDSELSKHIKQFYPEAHGKYISYGKETTLASLKNQAEGRKLTARQKEIVDAFEADIERAKERAAEIEDATEVNLTLRYQDLSPEEKSDADEWLDFLMNGDTNETNTSETSVTTDANAGREQKQSDIGSESPVPRFEGTASGSGEQQGVLLTGQRELGRGPSPRKTGNQVGTSELLDGFTSTESVQAELPIAPQFKGAKEYDGKPDNLQVNDEVRVDAAHMQQISDHYGDGTIHRLTERSRFEAGTDQGNPEYGHKFAYQKDPVRGVTSFAINADDDIISVKDEAASGGGILYAVRPEDIGGMFVVVRKSDNSLYVYSNSSIDTSKADVVSHGMALKAKAEGIEKAKTGYVERVLIHDQLTDEEIFDDLASLGVEVFGREGRSQVSQQGQGSPSQVTPATSGPSTTSDDLTRKQENSARIKVIDSIIADHKSGKDRIDADELAEYEDERDSLRKENVAIKKRLEASFSTASERPTNGGVSVETLNKISSNLSRLFPEVRIATVESPSDLQQFGINAPALARGVYHDGTVYLVRSNIQDNVSAAQSVLSHELTHHGVMRLGERGEALLSQIGQYHPSEIKEILQARGWENTTENRIKAANELVAQHGETKLRPNWWTKVKEFLRSVMQQIMGKPVNTSLLDQTIQEIQKLTKQDAAKQGSPQTTAEPAYSMASQTTASTDPEVEKRWQAASGLDEGPGLVERSKAFMHRMLSETQHFPNLDMSSTAGKRTADTLRRFESSDAAAKAKTAEYLHTLTKGFDPQQMDLFTRKVILDDLINEADKGHDLPFGYTPETLQADHARISDMVEASSKVKASVKLRADVNKAMVMELVDNGLLPVESVLTPEGLEKYNETKKYDAGDINTAYFRHQVLEHVNAKKWASLGTSGEVSNRKRGWQKNRQGSELDINTNFLEAEFEVYSQSMKELATKKTLDEVLKINDMAPELRAQAAKDGLENWRSLIPEGHTVWRPEKGSLFYKGQTMPETLITQFIEENPELEEVMNAFREKGLKGDVVIPEGLAKTLDNLRTNREDATLDTINKKLIGGWKVWTLLSPRRALKYNLNNMSGDLDIALAADPGIMKHFSTAWRHGRKRSAGQPMTQDELDMIDRGVIDAGISINEIPDINKLPGFKNLKEGARDSKIWDALKSGDLSKLTPPNLLAKYFDTVSGLSRLREGLLREAAYLRAKELLDSGKNIYWASKPAEIDALDNNTDKAAKLSRELLGDYGNISAHGEKIRTRLIPFWSWMEINAPRYYRLFQNAATKGEAGSTAARLAGVGARKVAGAAIGMGEKAILANLLFVAISAFNHLVHPDEEDKIGDSVKGLHIILGSTAEGRVLSMRFQGAFSDVLAWAGLEDFPTSWQKLQGGRMDSGDMLKKMALAAPNKLANATSPFFKLGAELASGKQFYPDVTQPRQIRDRSEHVARFFSLDEEYKAIAGKPTKGYLDGIKKSLIYEGDPGEAAYQETKQRVMEFLKKQGKDIPSGAPTDRSNALYYYRQAVRYGDEEAAARYRAEYLQAGGKSEGIQKGIKNAHPLAYLPENMRRKFNQTLSDKDRQTIKDGENWYRMVYQHRPRA